MSLHAIVIGYWVPGEAPPLNSLVILTVHAPNASDWTKYSIPLIDNVIKQLASLVPVKVGFLSAILSPSWSNVGVAGGVAVAHCVSSFCHSVVVSFHINSVGAGGPASHPNCIA